jgi:hypothetical protein
MKTLTNPTPRAQALSLAWQLVKTARLPFVKAQAQAWATIRLKTQMQAGPVAFWYVKDDGTTRYAIGHFIPTSMEGSKPASPLVVRYFDTLANGWRSFRADRLIIA